MPYFWRYSLVYITGKLRQPAEQAMPETKIAAIAVGHRRSEVWALSVLAGMLRERWASLEVLVAAPADSSLFP